MTEVSFPLYAKAERAGILDGKSALIVAPTATGKSHIGREAICRALSRPERATHVYLVPFRALASEIFESFKDSLGGTGKRVRISTGDHRDPLIPEEADLLIATYESFASLMRRISFRLGIVVADEIHLLADEERGPGVEGLFARLLYSGHLHTIIGLSAVIENADELARWLGVTLLEGTDADRAVPLVVQHEAVDDLSEALVNILEPCAHGEQALIFCHSRHGAEKCARVIAGQLQVNPGAKDVSELKLLADRVLAGDPDAEELTNLIPAGVAYHHAGLTKQTRREIECGFNDRHIRVIAATPTLAAGINLPASIAVVRDIFRRTNVRGSFRPILLTSGEILNMLGRAARPLKVDRGVGIALLKKENQSDPGVKKLLAAIKAGRGGRVLSRLPESFEGIMRFVLTTAVERGEMTRDCAAEAFSKTLAYFLDPVPISFDCPFEEEMMEDLPAYQRVVDAKGAIHLQKYFLSPAGVDAVVASKKSNRTNHYNVTISITGVSCDCLAASKFYRGEVCKHAACAIHDLLFTDGIEKEAWSRAVYNCTHIFGATLDLGTRLSLALELLTSWGLLERVPSGWRATPLGEVASAPGFDLLLVHQVALRIVGAHDAKYTEIARWAVEDYFEDDAERKKWLEAVEKWIGEVDARKIRLPVEYRGDFENRLEDLSRVCSLYEKAALAMGNQSIVEEARSAAGAIRYGVRPELVRLMGLGLTQLGRARARHLFRKGIGNLQDLAAASIEQLAHPQLPETFLRQWIERAREIYQTKTGVVADQHNAQQEFDELVSRFRLDPAALA
jgi:helicase